MQRAGLPKSVPIGATRGTDLPIDWLDTDWEAICAERVERINRLRQDPDLANSIASLKEAYKDDPALFISHWGFTFDPRNIEIEKPAVIPFILFHRQEQYIDWLRERWQGREDGLVEKSRDMGVTWLCVGFAVWMWLFYPGSVVGFGSRKEDLVDKIGDPDSIFWKIRFFIDLLPDELKPAGYNGKAHAPFMRVINPENGSVLRGESGDDIGRGGRTSIYFIDEGAHLEHDGAVDAALSQTSNCKVWVSTPNGVGNVFYKKRHSNRIAVFVFDWKQDPRKGKDWYAKQVNDLDPVVLAQEVNRDYESSMGDAWITGDLVTQAQMRGPADVVPMGGLRVGVDVARFGDDKTVISFRRGRVLLKQVKKGKLDVMAVASAVKEELRHFKEKPEQIAVDTIGIGAGVADILRSDGWFPDAVAGDGRVRKIVVDVNNALRMSDGENYNLRSWQAREVKEWLKTASIPNDPDLKVACTCFKYKFKAGELLCESKEDVKKRIGRSPDEYDSLACTFAVPTIVEAPPPPQDDYQPAVAGVGM